MQRRGGSGKRRTDRGEDETRFTHGKKYHSPKWCERNADFKTVRASCKTLQLANQHGLLSPLGDWETWSFGGFLSFSQSPKLRTSQ